MTSSHRGVVRPGSQLILSHRHCRQICNLAIRDAQKFGGVGKRKGDRLVFIRDKASLDIFWLRDESLEESDNLPDPEVLGAETLFHSNTW